MGIFLQPVTFLLPPRALAVVNASAAETFGVDFTAAAGPDLGRDWAKEAADAGAGAIGWDDMWLIPNGASYTLWIGGGQPGFGAAGVSATFVTAGEPGTYTNLAACYALNAGN